MRLTQAQAQTTASKPEPGSSELSAEEQRLLDAMLQAGSLPSVWSTLATLRATSGYRDNVLLSSFNEVSAPFLGFGADVIASRLPTDGTEVTLLGSGEYTVFLDAPETEPEALALAQAGIKRDLGSRWKCGLDAEYVYLHQVFDLSVTEAARSTVLARGNTFMLTPNGSLDLGRGWSVGLKADGTRQLYTGDLDDYWEAKPAAVLNKTCTERAEFDLTYTFGARWYDSRPPLSSSGEALPGRLEFQAHEVELRSKVFWDPLRRWRTQLRLGWVQNQDDGGGYFDFTRLAAGAEVRYQAGPWSLRADGRVRWYSYPVQRSNGADSSLRERTDLVGLLRAEFQASRKLRVFVQYERDSSADSAPDASYDANGLTAGVEWDL